MTFAGKMALDALLNVHFEPAFSPIFRLTTLNGQRARVLYNAKIESVALLANSSPSDVENILQNARPFESKKSGITSLRYRKISFESHIIFVLSCW